MWHTRRPSGCLGFFGFFGKLGVHGIASWMLLMGSVSTTEARVSLRLSGDASAVINASGGHCVYTDAVRVNGQDARVEVYVFETTEPDWSIQLLRRMGAKQVDTRGFAEVSQTDGKAWFFGIPGLLSQRATGILITAPTDWRAHTEAPWPFPGLVMLPQFQPTLTMQSTRGTMQLCIGRIASGHAMEQLAQARQTWERAGWVTQTPAAAHVSSNFLTRGNQIALLSVCAHPTDESTLLLMMTIGR